MRRWVLRLVALLVALPLLLALALGGALLWANSEPGRERVAALVAAQVPGLRIEGLEGPLPGRLGIRRLTMADAGGVWLEVEGARLAWDPRALLRREARISLLAADRIALHRLPESRATDPTPPGPLIPDLPVLPLAIRLDALALPRIELAEAVLGTAVALRAEARGRLDPWGLTLALDAQSLGNDGTLGIEASLRPGSGRLSARVTLRGAQGGAVARLIGLPDRAPNLDLTLDGPTEAAALTLTAEAGPGLALTISGTLRAPDVSRIGADLSGRIEASALLPAALASLAAPVEFALRAQRLPDGAVDFAALRLAHPAALLEASGRVLADGQRLSLGARLNLGASEAFAGLLPGVPVGWQALTLEGTAEGPLAAPALDLRAEAAGFRSAIAPLAALLGPAPRLTFQGTPPDSIGLLTLSGAALRVEARGRVAQVLDLRFAADVESVDGAAPGVAGALRLSGTATGPLADPSLTLEAGSDRLEVAGQVLEALALTARIASPASAPAVEAALTGRFQGLPLVLDLRGAPDGDALRLTAARASLGPAVLTVEGLLRHDPPLFEGVARLDVPDLAPLSPLAGQPLAGSLALEATGTVRDGAQHLAARLTAPRLVQGGREARDLVLAIEGTAADATLQGTARGFDAEAELRVTQTAQPDGARRFDLAVLRISRAGEALRLAAPGRITLRPDGTVEIGALTFAAGHGATLRAQGSWAEARADIQASLTLPDLGTLDALLPDVAPRGRVAVEARITGRGLAPEVVATLRASQLRATAPWARGVPPGEVTAEIRRNAAGALTARATANLGPATRLTGTASLPRGPGDAAPIEAALDGSLDLAAALGPLLAAGADRVTGRLTLALRASGTVAEPRLGGEARLTGGAWRNALLGVALTDLAGTLRPEGTLLRLDVTGRTPGEGRIALAGTIDPLAAALPVDLALRATQAQPVASDLARAVLDADLRLAGSLRDGATLSGPVRLRRIEIRVPEELPSSVRSLGPVTERGRPAGRPPSATPLRRAAPPPDQPSPVLPITLALTVEAPRGIFVRGRGLDVELGGNLAIGGPLAAPEVTGEIGLRRGEINVVGRRLALSRAGLVFQGGLIPDLDFEATSQAGGTTVKANVTGPPSAPEITFSSTPELPQDEVLARLLFDRPLRELSPFEIAQIAQGIAGAAGIGGTGASGLLDRLRQGLGLDRLSVGGGGESATRTSSTEERGGPTLEAGRYIADGIYVGVRQGTDAGSSRVGVRVDLTPRLRLEAETGDREAGERVGVSMEWQWGR